VQWVSVLVLFVLTVASNVFVDPKTMPAWLETSVSYNPVTHLVSAVRDLMSGTFPAEHIAWLLVGCAAIVAVFAPITMRLYRNKR
jgi:ABC-2 type transport system permease protein